MTTRRTALAVLLVVSAVLAGCSGDGDDDGGARGDDPADEGDEVPTEAAVSLTFAPDAEVTAADLEQAVAVVERRIEALEVEASVAADPDEGTVVVGLADDDPAVADQVTGAVEARGELRFRPVLATDPAGTLTLTPAADDRANADVNLADKDDLAHALGPTEATGALVESAEAEVGPVGDWQVLLVLHPGEEGIDTFNRIAATCLAAEPTCPLGQLAIVLDSVVQSAPTIQEPSYERDAIVITGNLSADDARNLATVLESGALPFALTLRP